MSTIFHRVKNQESLLNMEEALVSFVSSFLADSDRENAPGKVVEEEEEEDFCDFLPFHNEFSLVPLRDRAFSWDVMLEDGIHGEGAVAAATAASLELAAHQNFPAPTLSPKNKRTNIENEHEEENQNKRQKNPVPMKKRPAQSSGNFQSPTSRPSKTNKPSTNSKKVNIKQENPIIRLPLLNTQAEMKTEKMKSESKEMMRNEDTARVKSIKFILSNEQPSSAPAKPPSLNIKTENTGLIPSSHTKSKIQINGSMMKSDSHAIVNSLQSTPHINPASSSSSLVSHSYSLPKDGNPLSLVPGTGSIGSDGLYRVGLYTKEERRTKIDQFREKKRTRIWRKQIKYDCRKRLADTRPRVKGRFVSRRSDNQNGEHSHIDDDSNN